MNKILLSLFGVSLILSCKQKTNSVKEIADNQPIKDSLTLEIKNLNKNYFNGLAVAIVDSTGVLYEKGIGFADIKLNKTYTINTIQPLASDSTTFIGISLMIAQEKGLLNLDEPINKYLSFKVQNSNFPNEPITIRQLATHTSSIVDNENYMNRSYVLKDKIDNAHKKIKIYLKVSIPTILKLHFQNF